MCQTHVRKLKKVFSSAENDCQQSAALWDCGDNIVGMLGPQTSAVSLEIASMGRLLEAPLVSYLSTSVTLCQREKFPNFFRTVPSDKHQARAIVELLKNFGWNYASFVHSDSEYGTTGYQLVKQAVEKSNEICLADPLTIYNKQFVMKDYKKVVETLLYGNKETEENGYVKPKVVIVFADRVPAGKILQAAKELGVKNNLTWIGSDAWASRESVVENREEFVEGAIAIQPLRRVLPDYNEYFRNLITSINARNPWFDEYLAVYHNCTNDSKKMNVLAKCKQKEGAYRDQVYIHFVRDAVYAFAQALHDLHVDSCGGFEDRLCPLFKERVFVELNQYLPKVRFNDPSEGNFTFRFYSHNDSYSQGTLPHDGPPRYSIINFAKKHNDVYDWHNVGTYVDGKITEIEAEFEKHYAAPKAKPNLCQRKQCPLNHIKIPDSEDQCCWHCKDCGDDKYRLSDYECMECKPGQRSENNTSVNDTTCVEIPQVCKIHLKIDAKQ